MYKLTRRQKKKFLRAKWLILCAVIAVAALVSWLIWIRPMQSDANINTFEECAAAGNPIQDSYPEVCLTKAGKRFVNPKQDQAHQDSLTGNQDLVAPTNPELLNLDIEEWGVRVPLTEDTFDLTYAYIENGGSEYLLFTYKRLLNMNACKGDIGLTLTRSFAQHQPPYTAKNPAPTAQIDKYYFYANYAEGLCYDANNPEQLELVKKIAVDQTLSQATASLLTKLVATPKE